MACIYTKTVYDWLVSIPATAYFSFGMLLITGFMAYLAWKGLKLAENWEPKEAYIENRQLAVRALESCEALQRILLFLEAIRPESEEHWKDLISNWLSQHHNCRDCLNEARLVWDEKVFKDAYDRLVGMGDLTSGALNAMTYDEVTTKSDHTKKKFEDLLKQYDLILKPVMDEFQKTQRRKRT